jgi:hypothetical protein
MAIASRVWVVSEPCNGCAHFSERSPEKFRVGQDSTGDASLRRATSARKVDGELDHLSVPVLTL